MRRRPDDDPRAVAREQVEDGVWLVGGPDQGAVQLLPVRRTGGDGTCTGHGSNVAIAGSSLKCRSFTAPLWTAARQPPSAA